MPDQRCGLTLYEVVLALAILLPALAVLTYGVANGTRGAISAQLRTDAIFRADSLMSELAAGVRPLAATSRAAFDDGAPGWFWSAELSGGPHPDLLQVRVTVEHEDTTGRMNASWTLTRLLRDPQLFQMANPAAGAEATSGSTSGGSAAGGRTTSGTTTGGAR